MWDYPTLGCLLIANLVCNKFSVDVKEFRIYKFTQFLHRTTKISRFFDRVRPAYIFLMSASLFLSLIISYYKRLFGSEDICPYLYVPRFVSILIMIHRLPDPARLSRKDQIWWHSLGIFLIKYITTNKETTRKKLRYFLETRIVLYVHTYIHVQEEYEPERKSLK